MRPKTQIKIVCNLFLTIRCCWIAHSGNRKKQREMKLISQNKPESSSCHLSRTADSSCSSWFPLLKKKGEKSWWVNNPTSIKSGCAQTDAHRSYKKKSFIFSLSLFESRCNNFTSVIILTVILLIPGRIEELILCTMIRPCSKEMSSWNIKYW